MPILIMMRTHTFNVQGSCNRKTCRQPSDQPNRHSSQHLSVSARTGQKRSLCVDQALGFAGSISYPPFTAILSHHDSKRSIQISAAWVNHGCDPACARARNSTVQCANSHSARPGTGSQTQGRWCLCRNRVFFPSINNQSVRKKSVTVTQRSAEIARLLPGEILSLGSRAVYFLRYQADYHRKL